MLQLSNICPAVSLVCSWHHSPALHLLSRVGEVHAALCAGTVISDDAATFADAAGSEGAGLVAI